MSAERAVNAVREWQRASNEKDVERLLELSDPDIEILGPRGSIEGRETLRTWVSRAGLRLETPRTFAKGNTVVMSQRGVRRSPETGETTGEASLATRFVVENGRVGELARYDGEAALRTALEESGLSHEDEV